MFDLEDFPLLDAWMKWLLILKWNVLKWDSAYAFMHHVHVCKVNQQSPEIPLGCGKRQQHSEKYWEKIKMTHIWVILKKAKKIIILIHKRKIWDRNGISMETEIGISIITLN